METIPLSTIFTGKLNLEGWEKYKATSDYAYEESKVIGLEQNVYQKTIEGEVISVGVFHYRGTPAYIAWGLKSTEHCGFHATLTKDELVGEVRLGCPDVIPTKNIHGEVIGFTLDKQEIFGDLP